MARPPVQTMLYSLDRTQSLTAPPSEVDAGDRTKDDKRPDDVEANSQEQSTPAEIEQDDGVTRIEALCELALVITARSVAHK